MAVLYVGGAFEFSFISRRPLITDNPDVPPSPPVTTRPSESGSTPPDSNTTPPQSESLGGNETSSPETEPPTSARPDTTTPETNPSTPSFSPPTVLELKEQGYYITYNKYSEGMVIVSIPLIEAPTSLLFGKKPYREATKEKLYSDETFAHGTMSMTTIDRYSVETYMEYILVAGKNGISLYDNYGNYILTQKDLAPAYTRDRQDRPLFFIGSKKEEYYYYDDTTVSLVLSDYNDFLDGRGVYFNYNPLYGKSDNGIYAMAQEITYTKTYSINMSASYEKFNIGPEIARALYENFPVYAEKVARYNMRFAAALKEAKKEIAAEKKEEAQNSSNAETTLSPDETLSPDAVTGTGTTVQTTPAAPSVSDTLPSPTPIDDPEQTTAQGTTYSDTTAQGTTASGETGTDTATDTVTGETTPSDTTVDGTTAESYPSDRYEGTATLTVEFVGYRFGFGKSEDKITYKYEFARTYNFRGSRAAIVRDDGTLFFVNTSYRRTADGYSAYAKKIEGTESSVWYYVNYYEPLYKDIRGFGHLYYDSGYVMVRKAETEKMRNKRVGDDLNILLDANGKQVAVPSGYTLVTCTEGVMTLERLGRYGYYDPAKQEWLVSPVYTHADPFYEGMGVLCNAEGKYGVIDRAGNVIIPFEFDYISMMANGLVSAYVEDAGWQVFAKMTK